MKKVLITLIILCVCSCSNIESLKYNDCVIVNKYIRTTAIGVAGTIISDTENVMVIRSYCGSYKTFYNVPNRLYYKYEIGDTIKN